jgi:nucleoside-diphosphate kinase
MTRTVALIKPCAIRRALVGVIFDRIEKAGFGIIEARLLRPGSWSPTLFYGRQHAGAPYFRDLVEHMESGPSFAMILESDGDAIAEWRWIMGSYKRADHASNPTSLRAMLMSQDARPYENLVHGSDSVESYMAESWSLAHKFNG